MATIIKRGDSYCVKYRDPEKKQRWESFDTKKQAQARKSEVEHQKNVGKFVDPRNMKRLVGEAWASFKLSRWPGLRHTTQTLYALTWRVHVAPKWEFIPLRAVGTEAVEAWQAQMIADGSGPRTVQTAMQLFGAMFKVGMKHGWCDYSPVSIADKTKWKSDVRAFTPAQIAALIVEADQNTSLFIQVAAATGGRIGELFGLRWIDVDLDSAKIWIRQQYSHGQFGELKTKKARREITLDGELINPLREWKLRQPKGALGLVFPSPTGGPADAHNFYNRVWKPLLKKAGLPARSRFHSLRHSFATALIAGNENAKTVQRLMGHAKAAFTMDVYADYWPVDLDGVASRVSSRLFADVEAVRAASQRGLLTAGGTPGSKMVAATPSKGPQQLPDRAEVIDLNGGPCRDRTYDQLIKSQLLYQLS
jgi:integrase